MVKTGRAVRSRGGSTEELLRTIRAAGASPIVSMSVLHRVDGTDLGRAKEVVWASETWADMRPAHEEFVDSLLRAAEEIESSDTARR